MKRVYLVRHGENRANITKEFSSLKVDYSLTPKGVLQAQQTAEYFVDKDIHAVYASPMKRARETGQIIADRLGLELALSENFREVQVGDLEGQEPSAENWGFHNRIFLGWMLGEVDLAFPHGDNYHTLLGRMRAGIQEIASRADGDNFVVVGHGGIFTATLKDICQNVELGHLITNENHNCSISEILVEMRDGELFGELVSWSYTDHLTGEAAQLVSGFPAAASF